MVQEMLISISNYKLKIDILNGSLFTLDTLSLIKKLSHMCNGMIQEKASNTLMLIIIMLKNSLSLLVKITIIILGMEKLLTLD